MRSYCGIKIRIFILMRIILFMLMVNFDIMGYVIFLLVVVLFF